MTIRHVSLLRFTEDAREHHIAAIEAALSELPDRLPGLRAYHFGRDLGLAPGTFDFAVVADFDDVRGYEAYRDDSEHRRILTDMIGPLVVERAVAQYEVPGALTRRP